MQRQKEKRHFRWHSRLHLAYAESPSTPRLPLVDELCLVRVCSEYAHKIHLPKSERNSMEGFSKDD